MDKDLQRCSLREAGINAEGIFKFIEAAEINGTQLHSFMITRHGKVAFECCWKPYSLNSEHHMHSFTKGLVAMAIGILEGEKRIHLEDPVVSYFPEYFINEEPEEKLSRMTIHHLLTMTGGHDTEPGRHGIEDAVETFFRHPIVHEPGTRFVYNSMGSNVLGAIVKKVTGMDFFRFLQVRVLNYMGISDVYCEPCANGLAQGGGGSYLKTEDMAKITVLLLNKGKWNGQQLIPESWVERMSSVQWKDSLDAGNPNAKDWSSGYGYQVWQCQIPNSYRLDGLSGQFGVILKDYDATIITTCGELCSEPVLQLVWEYLVPALREDGADEKLSAYDAALTEKKKKLHTDWETETTSSKEEAEEFCKLVNHRDIIFPENDASVLPAARVGNCYTGVWTESKRCGIQKLSLHFEGDSCSLEYTDNQNHGTLPVGIHGDFQVGMLKSLWGDYEVWTTGRWKDGNTMEVRLGLVHGEYYQIFSFTPEKGMLVTELENGPWNKRFGKPESPKFYCEIK